MHTVSDSDQQSEGRPDRRPGRRSVPHTATGAADPRLPWARPVTPVLRRRRDGILPTIAAALSLPSEQTLTATAVRSGPPPAPHPLVRELLDGLDGDQRERHTGRCPEVTLLSRRLTAAGAESAGQARRALKHSRITTRHIREDGDPQHGEYARHCHSCTALLAHFGVRSVSPVTEATAALRLPGRRPAGRRGAVPEPAAVLAEALAEAGWEPGRRIAAAVAWTAELRAHLSPLGHPHAVFPAAEAVWAEFGGLELHPRGPGREQAPSPVVVEPLRGLHWARTLGDLGHALDTELAPLGEAGPPTAPESGIGGALLAIDREGRVYCLDHTGDWYLGATFREAATTLLAGRPPMRLSLPAG